MVLHKDSQYSWQRSLLENPQSCCQSGQAIGTHNQGPDLMQDQLCHKISPVRGFLAVGEAQHLGEFQSYQEMQEEQRFPVQTAWDIILLERRKGSICLRVQLLLKLPHSRAEYSEELTQASQQPLFGSSASCTNL